MVGVVALISEHSFTAHLGIHIGIFAIVLIEARPRRIAGKVDSGVVGPGHHRGPRLVSAYFCRTAGKLTVEGSPHVQVLGKEGASHAVGGAMVLVQTVKVGGTGILHRGLLDVLQQTGIEFGSLCLCVGGIQYGTDFVVSENAVNCSLAPRPFLGRAFGIVGKAVNVQLTHLSDLLFEGHFLQVSLDALLNLCIGRYGLGMAHSQSGKGKCYGEKRLLHRT